MDHQLTFAMAETAEVTLNLVVPGQRAGEHQQRVMVTGQLVNFLTCKMPVRAGKPVSVRYRGDIVDGFPGLQWRESVKRLRWFRGIRCSRSFREL